jgi:5-methylcytosine-specific restriction endonuclease McrA
MPLWKTRAYQLTERDIRYAMTNTKSNREAARFLRMAYKTYRKYATMYRDEESGKTLYELHKNVAGKGVVKHSGPYAGKRGLVDILEGKHPEYVGTRLKARLIREGFLVEECSQCGFSERRVTDYTVPLLLVWGDGNKRNHKLENLKLLCYNCYYLTYDNLFNRTEKADFKGY